MRRIAIPTLCVLALVAMIPGAHANGLTQEDYLSYHQPPAPLPDDLLFQGKPFSAACIAPRFDESGTGPAFNDVLLKNCPHPAQGKDCIFAQDHTDDVWFAKQFEGFHGYCYPEGGYIAYKYIGMLDKNYLLLVQQNGGGSLTTSDVITVQPKSGRLTWLSNAFPPYGVFPHDIKIERGKIVFLSTIGANGFAGATGISIRPDSLPEWGGFTDPHMLDDTDVAEFEDGKLKRVQLVPYTGNFSHPLPEENPASHAQNCFLKVHQAYLDKGNTVLSPEALKSFMQEVVDTCEAKPL